MTRILLVDDEQALRYALRSELSLIPELEVIGEAGDGVEAVRRAQELRPDLVVMDIVMPRMDGFNATRRMRELEPDIVVILHSLQDDPETRALALATGAIAFVAKRSGFQPLVDEILRFRSTIGSNGGPNRRLIP
jgi:DNA-binding NarL/FixJ family response regulator